MKQFIEIGSSHFNTLRYLCDKGWKGIMVDPIKIALDKIPNHIALTKVNLGIQPKSGNYDFVKFKDEHYFNHKLDYQGSATFRDDMYFYDMNHPHKEKISIPCITFDDLCSQNKINKIDYLKLDTEGMDLDILKTINFNKYDIKFIRAEHNGDELRKEETIKLLENNNYIVESFQEDLVGIKF